jgi:DinB superfamily
MSADDYTQLRPSNDEAFEYYFTYIRLVLPGNIIELAKKQIDELQVLFRDVPEAVAMKLHAPYTWTIKQVVGHMIDAERIFADRLHRFACGDFQPLPGMEQEPYVANCDYESPSLASLVDELCLCRQANVLLLRRLRPEVWSNRGIASGNPVTVRALACILVGHVNYHLEIVRKRLHSDSV